ncbi:hypothetical protein [Rhodocytophaga rosea]|nr:hypothetical protein [Rhodocytophaga rosea]
MQESVENKQMSLFSQEVEKHDQEPGDDSWKKSIPAQVFLNHFFGITYHILQSEEAYGLHRIIYFLNHHPELSKKDTDQIKKHLINCWSTEYALRSTAKLGDEQYLRNALHWTFPQAYYSIFAGVQAFLQTLGVTGSNEELIRREIGRLVVKGYYPQPVAFYAAGHYGDFKVHRLPLAAYKPSLNLAGKELEAQAQIGQFLRTTRRLRAQSIRQQIQNNPTTALRSKRTGEILQKFNDSHWHQLTWRVGYTTFFDLLGRLRISANHREIERFVEAEIDFKLFHQSLLEIVNYLNGIHECYIAQAMGLEAYQQMIAELPAHLANGFVRKRLEEKIIPVLNQVQPPATEERQLGLSA